MPTESHEINFNKPVLKIGFLDVMCMAGHWMAAISLVLTTVTLHTRSKEFKDNDVATLHNSVLVS